MAGQPTGFDVYVVVPTEQKGQEEPALVIEAGTNLTLKTYFYIDPQLGPIKKSWVKEKLFGPKASLEYHLQDLETGAMVPTIQTAKLKDAQGNDVIARQLDATEIADTAKHPALQAAPAGEYFVTAETEIETGEYGSNKTLCPPKDNPQSGTWRVLTHVHGGIDSFVSAFDDNLLINVTT